MAQQRSRHSGAVWPRPWRDRRCHRPRCSRRANRGALKCWLHWRLLAGPNTLPSSWPALAYRPGRVRGDPALPFPGLPLPAALGKLPATLPPHLQQARAALSSAGQQRGRRVMLARGVPCAPPSLLLHFWGLWRLHRDAALTTRSQGGCRASQDVLASPTPRDTPG